MSNLLFLFGCAMVAAARCASASEALPTVAWDLAAGRGVIAGDCGRAANRLLQGWIDLKQDPQTHLFSRDRQWDYHNEAADHYSSLVLVAFYVNPALNEKGGALHQTLMSSRQLCATPSGLPTLYDLKNQKPGPPATLKALTEWTRDGLIRIAEVMGTDNDWYRELERLTDAMLAEAARQGGVVREFGGDTENAGNMLQTLTRLYAMSGRQEYLRAAEELADHFLLDPDRLASLLKIKLLDHGCELVPGLGELFALEGQLKRPKAAQYEPPMRVLLDRFLQESVNSQTGLLCKSTRTSAGEMKWERPPDTWGYVHYTFENYDRATGGTRYRQAVEKPLRWLIENHSRSASLRESLWPRMETGDDLSDSYESFIVLWNRAQHLPGGFEWLDWAMHQEQGAGDRNDFGRLLPATLAKRYGPYRGHHFDGSVGRNLICHMLLCSQGVRCAPFVEGLRLGAVRDGERLFLTLQTDSEWHGKLLFDGPRTKHKAATVDWARINEMPQWFVAQPEKRYVLTLDTAAPITVSGRELIAGVKISATPGQLHRIRVQPL